MLYNTSYSKQIRTVGAVNLWCPISFEIIKRNETFYYLTDNLNNRVVIFNANWSFVASKNMTKPRYIKLIGDYIYITADKAVFKTDLDLNIINQSTLSLSTNGAFNEITYDSTNNTYVVATADFSTISQGFYYFNENLTFLYSYSLKNETPKVGHWSIQIVNGLYYSSAYNGSLKIFNKSQLVGKHQLCDGQNEGFTSANIYLNRYVLATCYNVTGQVILYHLNGTSTGFSLKKFYLPFSAKYTENNELIVTTLSYVYIYKLTVT